MELIKTQNQQVSTPLKGKECDIAVAIYYINILTPFKVDDKTLEDWSICINRLLPDVEISELEELMNGFMMAKFEYDHKLGIQNIFKGLAQLDPDKYEQDKMVY